MARAGDELRGTGGSIKFIETTEQSDGERVVVEITYSGGPDRPPAHFHPSQTEHFEVIEGEIEAVVDGERHVLRAGDTLDIPPGAVHEMHSEHGARQRWETTPALRTERFFETIWGLQQDGHTDARGVPSKLQMALTLRHFAPEFRLAKPPGVVQAVAFPLLAALARARGLKPEHRPDGARP